MNPEKKKTIKGRVIDALRERPQTGEQLARTLKDEKGVQAALEDMVRRGKVSLTQETYSLPTQEKKKPTAHREPSSFAASRGRRGVQEPAGRRRAAKAGGEKKSGRPAVGEKEKGIPCRIVRVNGGYGFAKPLAEGEEDIFVPGRYLGGALPGEEVTVALEAHPRRPGTREGRVLSVTSAAGNITGVLEKENGKYFLHPDFCPDMQLRVRREGLQPEWETKKVGAVLAVRGADYDGHVLSVQECFGDAQSAFSCSKAILYGLGVREEFPEKVRQTADLLAKNVPFDKDKRLDLTGRPIFTIDSASTKDMDDAIDVEREGDGYLLGVHIADVSHYVRPYSALDKEALRRGTSVYYANRVAPMLPKALSDELCSLNPSTERLTFSCLIRLDAQAEVRSFRFAKTVIRSRVKGVYEEINRLMDGEDAPELREKYREVLPQLSLLREVYEKLAQKRAQRGSMDIESGESKLLIDENGRCIGIKKRERGLTEAIIEECMILANGCAAKLAREKGLPFVYRVHTKPEEKRVETLKKVLGALGQEYHFAGDCPTQPELSVLLDQTRGTRLESAVHMAVLRSMPKANYRPEPLGHFGLALQDYAHFTSPIRRYPDLAIHRILSVWCEKQNADTCKKKFSEFVKQASEQSSQRELAAMEAERSVEDCYKAEYMSSFTGQSFEGTISSVTSFGIYVELDNTAEGLVRAEQLSTDSLLPEEGVALTDPLSGRRWAVGDRIAVTLVRTNIPLGQLDFVPAEPETQLTVLSC